MRTWLKTFRTYTKKLNLKLKQERFYIVKFEVCDTVTLKVPIPELSTTGTGGEGLTAGLGMISGRNMIYIFIKKQNTPGRSVVEDEYKIINL